MTAAAHTPTTGPYVAALTAYSKAKWKGILPLPSGAKWPPPDGHTGHNGTDPDGPTLVAWRNHHPNANIGGRADDRSPSARLCVPTPVHVATRRCAGTLPETEGGRRPPGTDP